MSRRKRLSEFATIPSDMPERQQRAALAALDALTAWFAEEEWATSRVYSRAFDVLKKLWLDVPAYVALAQERAAVRLEVAAMRAAHEHRRAA